MQIGWLNRLFGNRGERYAARYLKRLGYKIVARQARNKIGEIDLIALDGETLVMIEVKTRSSLKTGHPAESVGYQKQKQLTRTALAWLKERNLLDRRCRFDVIAIVWKENAPPTVDHFVNAFEAVGEGQLYS